MPVNKQEMEQLLEHFTWECDCEHKGEIVEVLKELRMRREKMDYEIMLRIRRRQNLKGIWLPGWMVDPLKKCPHINQRGIYGDEIILANFRRARCLDCGRLLKHLPERPV